jgi:fatty-acyl-CoA synthase
MPANTFTYRTGTKLPKNPSGKILKRDLRTLFADLATNTVLATKEP